MLPEGWKSARLGEVIKLSSGDKKPNDTIKEISKSHHIPVYGGNGIMGYSTLSNTTSECISIGRVGEYCGSVHSIKSISWITDNSLYTKEISRKCDFSFLYYLLVNSNIPNLRNKGGQPLVSQKPIYGLSILLPPLPEQKKIAAILSTWDRAIEGTEKLLANSQQQKKALMQQLLTGKKRLPGFTGEWRNITLAACCKPQQWATISSKDLTFSGFPVYGANGFIGYFSEYNHQNDTVTVTCRGSTCGTVSLIKGPSYITGNSMCLDQVKKDCSHIYLYYYLNHRGLKDIISGSAQPQIVGKAIQKVSVRLPSFPEQKAIAAVLTTADEEITSIESDLTRLRQEKKALMQQLLTGKRRVTVD